MANKEIISLPAMESMTDDTMIPVYQPGAESPAQRMRGAQFKAYAEQSVQGYVRIVEESRAEAEVAAQRAKQFMSYAVAAANSADGFAADAQTSMQAAESSMQAAAESSKSASAASAVAQDSSASALQSAQSADQSSKNAQLFEASAGASAQAAQDERLAAEAARDQAQLAAEKDITDLDDDGKIYTADWVIKGGHPVLVLHEKA